MDLSKPVISISDAEEIIGRLVIAIVENNPESVRYITNHVVIDGLSSVPRVRIQRSNKDVALAFIHGRIPTGKFGELLGLEPGDIHDFKNRCSITFSR